MIVKKIGIIILAFFVEMTYAQSPYTLKTNQEVALIGAGLAFEAVGIYLQKSVPPLTPEEIEKLSPEMVNPFDRGTIKNWSPKAGKASDYLLDLSFVLPATLLFSGKIRHDALKIAMLYGETGLYASFPTMITKSVTRRTRPYVYNDSLPLDIKTTSFARRSFYSGHTVTAFAASVFTAKVFSDYYPKSDFRSLVWGAALLNAGTVGYLRHVAGKHFPTDIIVGAAVGSFIGYIIPEIHKQKEKLEGTPQPDIAFSYTFQL